MQHWYINQYSNSVDVDFNSAPATSPPYNTYSYSVTGLPTTSGYQHDDGAVNGMYDMIGNLLFYIEDGTVYDKNGVNKGMFQYTGNNNTNEIAIIPFNNTCLKYHVIISTLMKGSTAKPRVLYGLVTLDDNYNVTSISDEGELGGYATNSNVYACSFAVSNSKNQNGDKYLYLVEGTNYLSSSYYGYLKRFTLTDNGISNQQTLLNGSVSGQKLEYVPLEVELNHSGDKLAWGSSFSYKKSIYVIDLNSNTISEYTNNVSDFAHGVEFSPDGSKLFFTNFYDKVKYIDFNDNNQTKEISGTSAAIIRHIELGPDGLLYSIGNSINPTTLAISEKNIPMTTYMIGGIFHYVSSLPDQIDGFDYYNSEHIKTCCTESHAYSTDMGYSFTVDDTWTNNSNPFNTTGVVYLEWGFSLGPNTEIEIQNMTFEFGPEANVYIPVSSKLVLDGTTFTGLTSCNTLWQGVIVEGTQNSTQTLESNQGVFEMKNHSYIKNAKIAIYVAKETTPGVYEGGGIIKIQQAHFENNHIDIWM